MKILRTILFILIGTVFSVGTLSYGNDRDYKQLMRSFIKSISRYAKKSNPDFIIIPQNGHELMREHGEQEGNPVLDYINAVDGAGQEDLFYGYDDDNVATPRHESDYLLSFLDAAKVNGVVILVTDYCWDKSKMDDSFNKNSKKGYISFAAPERDLNVIPDYPNPVRNRNPREIRSLSDAQNFLYLLDPGSFESKGRYLSALKATDYDVIIMDAFFGDDIIISSDVASLKKKPGGSARLVIAYMSIGEAEDYRYYWKSSWAKKPPSWLEEENPDWLGNYKVRYWNPEWQAIVFGRSDAYLDRIVSAGFDGVYLDIIDAFEYFE
ncbi:MAG: endo alpha-1,4 polygalactosaminidase [Spirochaetota bacterium]|nr:MAG: endo alpha-1,4 polygalactosaminidase [Spirochaetota bacterium]